MERKKSYNFPIQLAFQDKIYSIKGYIADDTQYIDGKGYIDEDDGQIYICSTKKGQCPSYHPNSLCHRRAYDKGSHSE